MPPPSLPRSLCSGDPGLKRAKVEAKAESTEAQGCLDAAVAVVHAEVEGIKAKAGEAETSKAAIFKVEMKALKAPFAAEVGASQGETAGARAEGVKAFEAGTVCRCRGCHGCPGQV